MVNSRLSLKGPNLKGKKRRVVTWVVPIILFLVSLLILEGYPSILSPVVGTLTTYSNLVSSTLLAIVAERILNKVLGEDSKAVGLAQAREKQSLEDERDWKKDRQEHSLLIAQAIREGWKTKSGVLASFSYENGKFETVQPKDPTIDYAQQAKAHLTTGYHGLWKDYEESKTGSLELSSEAKRVIDHFEKLVTEKIEGTPPALPRSNEWYPPSRRWWYPKSAFGIVFQEAYWRSQGNRPGEFRIVNVNTDVVGDTGAKIRADVKELSFQGSLNIARGNQEEMQELKIP